MTTMTSPARYIECLDCHGATHVGRVRPTNEDQFLIAELRPAMWLHSSSLPTDNAPRRSDVSQGQVLLVADGFGGHGDRASSIAVETVARSMRSLLPWFTRIDTERYGKLLVENLIGIFEKCQKKILASVEKDASEYGMGTTLTLAYVLGSVAWVIHSGDSRCYLQRNGQLEQVTSDHTVAARMLRAGSIDAEEARKSRWSNVLYNCLGGRTEHLAPEIYRLQLQPGDSLVMVTDGLTRHVDDEELRCTLEGAASAEEAVTEMLERANQAGGSDNITVVVARFGEAQVERSKISLPAPSSSDWEQGRNWHTSADDL